MVTDPERDHARIWWLGKCLGASSKRRTRMVTCPCDGAPEYFHQDEFRDCCIAAGITEFKPDEPS